MKYTATLILAATVACAALAQGQNPPGRDWSEIYLAESPSVSPDGTFLVFSWCGRIWRAPAAGGVAVPLGDGAGSDRLPVISPDGRKVAFVSNRAGADMPFELELGGDGLSAGGLRQISFHTQGCAPRAYTPDGSSLLATAFRDHSSESITSQRDSMRAILIPCKGRGAETTLFDAPAYAPALSPDGRRVLFVAKWEGGRRGFRKRRPGSTSAFAGEIWLYDTGSGAFSPVVTGRDGAYDPMWAPDGKSFYYTSDAGGIRNVRRRDLESGKDIAVNYWKDGKKKQKTLKWNGHGFNF